MTNANKILKVLLSASALTAFTAGSAFAQSITRADNDFTLADTAVSNTFTLSYSVDDVEQDDITNEDGADNDPDGPTVFTVDRLIDLTVQSVQDNTVAPGAVDETILFAVSNEGNDTHGFLLDILEEASSTTTSSDPTSGTTTITYYIDDGDNQFEPDGTGDGAAAIDYDPANPPELDPDDVLWVIVTRDIDATAVDGDNVDILLTSTASDATGTALVNDTANDTDLDAAAENVFADAENVNNAADGVADGTHSDTGQYLIASSDLEAEKSVELHSIDGTTCAAIPGTEVAGTGHFIPGACVEYVITVENDGSADAGAIEIADTLDTNLEFVAAVASGFSTGALTTVPAANADCNVVTCLIELTGGTLDAAASPGTGSPTVGTITIRAIIK